MSIRNEDAMWVVLDLETTGLDPAEDRILEYGAILVNRDLVGLDYTQGVVFCGPHALLTRCPEGSVVHKMHTDNGLVAECSQSHVLTEEADAALYAWLVRHGATDGSVQLIGNSIDFDIRFIVRQMLKTGKLLHHRCINISTINVLEDAWGAKPRDKAQAKSSHRALGDCQDSLNQLRAYKAKFWGTGAVGAEESK